MHTLHIIVNNKEAIYSARDGSIVCGNDDYQVQFALDSEWDGLAAKARFRWNGKHQDVPIVDGLAAVPRITNAHEVRVGVYSEDGSLQTTTAARVPCDKSILCGDSAPAEGNEAHYASEAQKAADRAEAAAKRAEAAGGNGGAGGSVVIDPESVNQAQEAAQASKESAEAAAASAEAASTSATVAAREAGNASKSAAAAATDRTAAQAAQAAAQTAMERAEAAAGLTEERYEPAPLDRPRIYITGSLPDSKLDDDTNIVLTYISRTERFTAYATAKVQGSSSTTFAKKNYTFKLFEDEARDEKKKVAFRNWPAENKFVAKANFIDRTHARNVVSCRIWGDMVRSREGFAALPAELQESPNHGAVDGFIVQIYVNGIYYGLYSWNIPKDNWMAGMSDCEVGGTNYDKQVIICGEGAGDGKPYVSFNTAYGDRSPIDGYDFDDETESVGDNTRANFKAFSDLVVNGTDEEFRTNLGTYLDIESAIDIVIYKWLNCDVDGLGKNQFFYTYNAGLPWYAGVYDQDATWGLRPEGNALVSYDTAFPDGYYCSTNRLYERIRGLFADEIRTRWNKVKDEALSLANIIQHFEAFHDPVPVNLFTEDSAETTADGAFLVTVDDTHKGFDSVLGVDESNLQQIRNFAVARWAYVDREINHIACTGVTLDKTTLTLTADNTTAALVATLTPSNCTETVAWTSSDEAVAKVSAGTVTGIFNGSCLITVTCGNYSATCSVTVSGFSEVGSDNLADPTDESWQNDYYYKDAATEPTLITEANKVGLYALSNLIEVRVGDVVEISGVSAMYSPLGYARVAIHNPATGELCTLINVNSYRNDGGISVADGVTTYDFSGGILTKKYVPQLANYGNKILVRFPLSAPEGETLNPSTAVIRRNPNGENAEAWS